MDRALENPVQLTEGVTLRSLLSSESEFSIDMDFREPQSAYNLMLTEDDMMLDVGDQSEPEDAYTYLEKKTDLKMLVSPKYHSFNELEKMMVDCHAMNMPIGAVKILILEEGTGPLVPPDAEVSVHYAAYWEKGRVPFDCTLTANTGGGPIRMQLGANKYLPGLETALTRVKGPRARLLALLQPVAAWGRLGATPRLPPLPALFVIVLFGVTEVEILHRFNDLPSAEQSKFETTLRTIQAIRNQGKDLFAKKQFHKAVTNYQQAVHVLTLSRPENENQEKELKDLKTKIYLNLAICYYKLEKPKYVLNMLDVVDTIVATETLPKALFYYGRAYQMLGQTEKAIAYYKKALKLEPKNKEIGDTLFQLDMQCKQSAEDEQLMWQKAFNSGPSDKKVKYNVDEDFERQAQEMCVSLSGRDGYSKMELPGGLSHDEVLCIETLARQFSKLIVSQDGDGLKKKVTLIKKP